MSQSPGHLFEPICWQLVTVADGHGLSQSSKTIWACVPSAFHQLSAVQGPPKASTPKDFPLHRPKWKLHKGTVNHCWLVCPSTSQDPAAFSYSLFYSCSENRPRSMAGEHYKHTRGQRWTSLMANAEIKAGDFFGVVKVTQAIFVDVTQCIGETAEGPVDINDPILWDNRRRPGQRPAHFFQGATPGTHSCAGWRVEGPNHISWKLQSVLIKKRKNPNYKAPKIVIVYQ